MAPPLARRPPALRLGPLLAALAALPPTLPSPTRAAQVEAPAAPAAAAPTAGAPAATVRPGDTDKPAMALWVRQVHGVVIKATNGISRRLALGTYRVSFTVDEHGRGSNYSAEGADPKQSSVITGALISRSFPAPPDGAGHTVTFTLRNGSPTAKPPAGAKPSADAKPSAGGESDGKTDSKPPADAAKP